MALKTKYELATDVMRQLALIDALHSPSAEDAAYIEGQYDDKYAELQDKGLAYWPNTGRVVEEIPHAVFAALSNIMADMVAPAYGVDLAPVMLEDRRQVSVGVAGMRDLRRHIAKQPSGEPTKAVYF